MTIKPRRAAGVIVLSFFCFVLTAASPKPERLWKCWHSADGSKKDVAVVGLVQEGGVLKISGAEFFEYTVLEDNDVGTVAVASHAEVGETTKHLGVDVVVIDKATLEFRQGNVFADGAGAANKVRRGKCAPPK